MMNEVQNNYFNLNTTIRAKQAAETIKYLSPLLEKVGITRIANVTGLDTINIPVALSIRPQAKNISVSQGKGATWELAYLSAVMESFEGYHAENPQPPTLHGSYRDLREKNYPVINPQLFQEGFFSTPDLESRSISWTKGIDLIANEIVFIPYSLIFLDSTKSLPESGFFSISSNGLAAGNTLEEAICHGLYEIIERDSLFWFTQLSDEEKQKRQIQINTITSKVNNTLIKKYKLANIDLKVWDISGKLGIPAFSCVISDLNLLRGLKPFWGSGAHLLKEIALARALLEAAQSRLTYISGSRDDIFMDHYQFNTKPYFNENFIGIKNYQNCYQPKIKNSFTSNIQFMRKLLIKNGFSNLFIIDHTKPALNVPVVNIFVPGMKIKSVSI